MWFNKKGVSAVIGYVLLVTFAVVIAGIVFAWLRTYVPQESLECPDGVSVYIKNNSIQNNVLTIYLKDNGNFKIEGLFVRYSTDVNQEIAVYDLTENSTLPEENKFHPGLVFDELNPNEIRKFDFHVKGIPYIYAIEVIPMRYETSGTKTQTVACGKAKAKEIIKHSEGEQEKSGEEPSGTCFDDGTCSACANSVIDSDAPVSSLEEACSPSYCPGCVFEKEICLSQNDCELLDETSCGGTEGCFFQE